MDDGAIATNMAGLSVGDVWDGYATIAQGNGIRISNGGTLYGGNVLIGRGARRTGNRYVIDGGTVGSAVVNGSITIGTEYSSGNGLTLANATLASSSATIGNSATNNSAAVYHGGEWNLGGATLTVGYNASGVGNELALHGGTVTNLVLYVGRNNGVSNRVVLAGGRLTAASLSVGTGNAIAPVVDAIGLVPLTETGTATFGANSFIAPSATEDAATGTYTVLAAETISGGENLELSAETDPAKWSLDVTDTAVILQFKSPATLVVIR